MKHLKYFGFGILLLVAFCAVCGIVFGLVIAACNFPHISVPLILLAVVYIGGNLAYADFTRWCRENNR